MWFRRYCPFCFKEIGTIGARALTPVGIAIDSSST